MFENGFGTIRNFIFAHSRRIVQDDSGIPLAYFDPNKWNLRLFGTYLGPIDLFKQHYSQSPGTFRRSIRPRSTSDSVILELKEANLIVADRR